MMTKTFDCVECGASAPYGRLSCPSCGALLASVTGGRKPTVRVAQAEAEPHPEPQAVAEPKPEPQAAPTPPPAAVAPAAVAPAPVANVQAAPADPVKTTPTRKRAVPPPPPFSDAPEIAPPAPKEAADTAPTPSLAPSTARTPHYAPTPAVAARERTAAAKAADEAARAAIVPLLEPSAITALPPTPWDPIVEPPPVLTGRPYQRHLAPDPDPVGGVLPPPSAYRPPSPALAMAVASANEANDAERAYASPDGSGALAGEMTAASGANRWFSTITDPARFAEIADWFIVVGATMSLLGFLLPWSRAVIGATSFGGYFDGWGLASPTHLVVFIGLLAILAMAILRDPVPAWISSGILGLVFGGLLLGLAWPYLVGPLGADVGLTMTTLGGVTLVIGGVVAIWATRHGAAEPLV